MRCNIEGTHISTGQRLWFGGGALAQGEVCFPASLHASSLFLRKLGKSANLIFGIRRMGISVGRVEGAMLGENGAWVLARSRCRIIVGWLTDGGVLLEFC